MWITIIRMGTELNMHNTKEASYEQQQQQESERENEREQSERERK